MKDQFYLLVVVYPVVIVVASIIGGAISKRILSMPSLIFAVCLMWVVLEITMRSIGLASLLGWLIAYTVLSLVVVLIVRSIKNMISN